VLLYTIVRTFSHLSLFVYSELAYTPMMNSEKFAVDAEYRKQEFQTTPEDRPLVAHFSANNPQALLAAARHIEDQCDAIDLNLGR
jgi:tRNA-dihydrouridine synthase 1